MIGAPAAGPDGDDERWPEELRSASLSTERTDGVRWEGEGAGGNGCGRRKEGGGGLTSARFLDRLAAPSSSPPLDERFRAWRRAGAWFASSECACHADSSGHPGKGASIASQLRGKTDEVKPLTLASLAPSRRVGVNDSVPQLHLELSEAATDELGLCFLVSQALSSPQHFTRRVSPPP